MDVYIAPPPVEEDKFEIEVRCMSTKIPIKSNDTINTERSPGILTVLYELLK